MPARILAALRSAVYATGFVVAWAWLALAIRPFDATLRLSLPAGSRALGSLLMLASGSLALACVMAFVVHGRGTPAPFDPPRTLVAWGPYRWVRNPMYWGGLGVLVGFGLWHRSLAMMLVAVPAALLAHVFVVLVEEPSLTRRFGEAYDAYRNAVPRWLPRPPSPRTRWSPTRGRH